MKKLFLFLLLCVTLLDAQSQVFDTTCIVSNTNSGWGASHDSLGPFGPVFDVFACTNDCYIECQCGPNYATPNVSQHFDHCCDRVFPIWGAPAPWDCDFLLETFWFRQTFQFDSTACTRLVSAMAHIQADQRYRFYLNGNLIDTSTNGQWNQDFMFSLDIDDLVNGENEILIRVENVGGGDCFNYAFLAFCLEVVTTPAEIDASFDHDVNQNDEEYTITCTADNTDPDFNHEWLVFFGDTPDNQPNLLGYFPDHGPVLEFVPSEEFEDCVYFLVLHRIYVGSADSSNCSACWAELIPICRLDGKKAGELGGRVKVDCGIFDQYHKGGKPGGDRSIPSSGNIKGASLQVSPNPTQDMLHVQWAEFNATQLKVLNFSGQVLEQKDLVTDGTSLDLQVGSLPAGLYILELTNQQSGGKLTQLFSVKK